MFSPFARMNDTRRASLEWNPIAWCLEHRHELALLGVGLRIVHVLPALKPNQRT